MAKSDIKTCRYKDCKHTTKEINITTDEYVLNDKFYYHKDCFDQKNKEKQVKADIQLIRNLWEENISRTVVYNRLYKVLNDLLARGIASDYLVFTMIYIVKNHMNLRYPEGFRYYVDNAEIKKAYDQKKIKEVVGNVKFKAIENEQNTTKFSAVNTNRPKGFQSILKNS